MLAASLQYGCSESATGLQQYCSGVKTRIVRPLSGILRDKDNVEEKVAGRMRYFHSLMPTSLIPGRMESGNVWDILKRYVPGFPMRILPAGKSVR